MTWTLAGTLEPDPFVAIAEYVCRPGPDPDAVHADVTLEHPVQLNDVGPLMQVSDSVICVPTIGVPLLAASVHTGLADGSAVGEHIATGAIDGP